MRPAQRLARGRHFRRAERAAVHVLGTLLVGRALADHRAAADQAGAHGLGTRGLDRGLERRGVVAIDVSEHLPAIGLEAPRGVVGEPALDMAVDRDAVVVIERDQLTQAERARQRTHLVRDALHEAAVADEGIGVVVDHGVTGAVVARGQHLLRQRHADRVADTLTERAGGGLHAGGVAILGVARSLRVELAKGLQLLHRQRVAAQVQQGIQEHGAVAVRQHETVAVEPAGIRGVVDQKVVPQHLGDVGHAHRRAGMPAFRFLHGVHAEGTDRVGEFETAGHAGLLQAAGA